MSVTSSRRGRAAARRRAEHAAVAHQSTLLGRHLSVRMNSVRRVHLYRCLVVVVDRFFRPPSRTVTIANAFRPDWTVDGHVQILFDWNYSGRAASHARRVAAARRTRRAAAGTATTARTRVARASVRQTAATSASAIRSDFNLLQLSRRWFVQTQIRIKSRPCFFNTPRKLKTIVNSDIINRK